MYTCKFSFLSFFSSTHSLFPSYSNLFFFFQIGWRRYCCSILLVESRLLASNPLPLSRWPNIPDILFHFHFHIHFHFPHPLSISISTLIFHIHFYFPFPLSLSTPTFHIHFHFSYPLSLSNSLFTIYFYALWKEKSLYRTSSHYHVGQTSLPTKSMANHPQIFVWRKNNTWVVLFCHSCIDHVVVI